MPLRPPLLYPVQLVRPCICRSSSLTMTHAIRQETNIDNEKQVEISKNDDTSTVKQGDIVSRTPARKITDFTPILKHLGHDTSQPRPNVSATASNKIGQTLSASYNDSIKMDLNEHTRTSTSEFSVSSSEEPGCLSMEDVDHKENFSLPYSGFTSATNQSPSSRSGDGSLKDNDCSDGVDYARVLEEHSLPTSFGKHVQPDSRKQRSSNHSFKDGSYRNRNPTNKRCSPFHVFDICHYEADDSNVFSGSLIDFSDERKLPEVEKLSEEPRQILRPGMVLLKGYISNDEQVSIVRTCRKLGVGPGGFYQPGFKDGAKLRLYMMCLGLDWDPQTRKYYKIRQIDRSKPPNIALKLRKLVDRAMQDSLTLIRRDSKVSNAEDILPMMNPNVCIVNFYTESGRLGLHQDRDESRESLTKGLPVVSFSLGDSAEFLYGDQRDINTAEKLILESGDVLIFGGQSRHVFHGVASIIPDTAPRFLLEETGLRPGRLNLSFRQN